MGSFIYRIPTRYRTDAYKAFMGRSQSLVDRITATYHKLAKRRNQDEPENANGNRNVNESNNRLNQH